MTINDGMVVQAILWRQLDVVGSDACALIQHAESWRLTGAAVLDHEGAPCRLAYEVDCSADWRADRGAHQGFLGAKPSAGPLISRRRRYGG
jgi:hypothetical protein